MRNPLLIVDEPVKQQVVELFGKDIAELIMTKDVTKYSGQQEIPSTATYAEKRFRKNDGSVSIIQLK